MAKTTLATNSNIITNLVETALKIKIDKVTRLQSETEDADGKKPYYFMISAINLATGLSLSLSISETMLQQFGFDKLIVEGSYLTSDNPPIYTHLNAVFIPNDGNTYGYEKKNKDGSKSIVEYKANNTWIIKKFHGALSHDYISAYELSDLKTKELGDKAKGLFRIVKGYEYVPNVSVTDDDYFVSLAVKF